MRRLRQQKGGADAVTEGFKRLSGAHGISLEVSHHFSEIAEAEREPVVLAAWVDPWPQEDLFRPNLMVEVEPLTPATATIQQLSSRTIAAQIALGRHLVGCEYVPAEDAGADGPARTLVAIYPALATTVVQWQRVAIIGNRAVIVTMQASAANYAAGTRAFAHACRTLRSTYSYEPVLADPELMPSMDPLGLERGTELEDLSGIAARQTPAAADSELEALDEGPIGDSEQGLVIELREQDAEPRTVVVPQRLDARPVALAQLLRVAPAWIWGFSDADRSGLIDRGAFEARQRDSSTPPPSGATPGLLRVWAARWRAVTIADGGENGLMVAEGAGAHGFKYEGESVRLTPMGASEILRPLLQLAGFPLE